MVPKTLKTWFAIHFLLDITAGFPLLFFPTETVGFLGFSILHSLPTRLVGAALIGIGCTSFLKVNSNLESYISLLTLKIIWSFSALIGILLSLPEYTSYISLFVLTIFLTFNIVWIYYYIKIKSTH